MKIFKKPLCFIFLCAIAFSPQSGFADGLDEARVKELVLEAIRENPEIVLEAVSIIEKRQADAEAIARADVLKNQRDLLEQDPNAPVIGNPDGDVTVVEFFDYNCPYCRRAMPEVIGMMDDDQNLRIVYREWPILGEGSVFAARAALAARNQGKYEAFHWALMGMKQRAEEATVLRIADDVGLDIDQLREDMQAPEVDAHISQSIALAQALGFNGTPSFVIGDELVPGFVEKAALAELVEKVRNELP